MVYLKSPYLTVYGCCKVNYIVYGHCTLILTDICYNDIPEVYNYAIHFNFSMIICLRTHFIMNFIIFTYFQFICPQEVYVHVNNCVIKNFSFIDNTDIMCNMDEI